MACRVVKSMVVALVLLCCPTQSLARGDFQGPVAGGLLILLAEVAIPDVKYEVVSPNDHGLALTWPITHPLANFGLKGPVKGQFDLALEPQWQIRDEAIRLLAGTRFSLQVLDNVGPLLETGGLAGTDGVGGMVGGGLFIGTKINESLTWGQFALVYRREWTTGKHRHVFFLDIAIIFPFTRL